MTFCRETDLDFNEVTNGSMILVMKEHELSPWRTHFDEDTYIHFEINDIWVIKRLANRPRVALIHNLQRGTQVVIRVDALLELDDKGVITIGPA